MLNVRHFYTFSFHIVSLCYLEYFSLRRPTVTRSTRFQPSSGGVYINRAGRNTAVVSILHCPAPRSRRQVAKTRKTQRTPRSHKFNLFVVDSPGGALPVGPRPSALTWHMHLKRWRRLRVRFGRLRHHRPHPWTPDACRRTVPYARTTAYEKPDAIAHRSAAVSVSSPPPLAGLGSNARRGMLSACSCCVPSPSSERPESPLHPAAVASSRAVSGIGRPRERAYCVRR